MLSEYVVENLTASEMNRSAVRVSSEATQNASSIDFTWWGSDKKGKEEGGGKKGSRKRTRLRLSLGIFEFLWADEKVWAMHQASGSE